MFETGAGRPGRQAWSVAGLIGAVASLLEHDFAACSVTGEISGFSRAASGHCYFNLKDGAGEATLRCAMFRRAVSLLAGPPANGQAVELRGRLAVYEPRGELQFIVESLQQSGAGALYERFVRLRARLDAEGLFDVALKRPLPTFPASVGVVTSLAGAALHDVATTLARRSPHVRVIVYPSVVQGIDAPASLCEAVSVAGRRDEVDVLVVCRGGGSLEDLWAFNDERVVRAIRAAPMPVISGVGHETDVTLADMAADLRAATPTAAAELVAPATSALRLVLEAAEIAIARRSLAALETQAQRLDRIALRLARPSEAVRRRAGLVDLLAQRLDTVLQRTLDARRVEVEVIGGRLGHALSLAHSRLSSRVDAAAARLHGLDPERVLKRGYALLVSAEGRPIVSVAQLASGQSVQARVDDGTAWLEVKAVG